MHEGVLTTPINHEFFGAGVPAQEIKMRRSLDPSREILPVRRRFIEAFYLLDDLLVFIARQKPSDDRR
ncbi:MAG: hypothetical protein ACREX9_11520 [Gammaproteobacteria bacterium]